MQNKKIRNATPTTYEGQTYRSKLEARFAAWLVKEGLDFEYEGQTWQLLPRMEYRGEVIRAVTYTPDFIIDDTVVEVKGYRNDVYPLKRKLIIKFITEKWPDKTFMEVFNLKDIKRVIDHIKGERFLKSQQKQTSNE